MCDVPSHVSLQALTHQCDCAEAELQRARATDWPAPKWHDSRSVPSQDHMIQVNAG